MGAVSAGVWNDFISHLSRGLLYGNEVERPGCAAPRRQRVYAPRKVLISAESERRKAAVLRRMLQRWTYKRIAAELKITIGSVNSYGTRLCAEHGVRARGELAAKLDVPPERLALKRDLVYAALAAGKRVSRTVRETGFSKGTVTHYAWKFRQERLNVDVAAATSSPRRTPAAAAPAPP